MMTRRGEYGLNGTDAQRRSRARSARFRSPLMLAVVAALAATGMIAVACGGGGGKKTATSEPTFEATVTPEPAVSAGIKSPVPVSPGSELTDADLAARGSGEPGRGEFTGDRLIIPKINVDAPFSYKLVGGDGQMPNPTSWDDVAYYDFSNWPGLGGLPNKGGNIVVAGHVDYIRHGPAVFWDLHQLEQGDRVQVHLTDGSTVDYEVMFNKTVGAEGANYEQIVHATADESITLITCTGDFAAGHYNNRQIVWARRV